MIVNKLKQGLFQWHNYAKLNNRYIYAGCAASSYTYIYKNKTIAILTSIIYNQFNMFAYADIHDIIRPYSDYISNWYTTSDSDNIVVAGIEMPAILEVKVIKGLFVKDKTMGPNEAALVLDGAYESQEIVVNAINCNFSKQPQWQRLDGGKYWNTSVRVSGISGETYYSSTLTKSEATSLLLGGGVDFKIKGVQVKTKAELDKAYGNSTSMTVSYKLNSSYNSSHDIDMRITGLGSINVTVN